jgi:hypothetical protein
MRMNLHLMAQDIAIALPLQVEIGMVRQVEDGVGICFCGILNS